MEADAMAGMNDKINTLTEKMEQQDINNAKKMIVLSGFDAHQKKYIARKQLDDFFYEQIKVEVNIEEFYYIGRSTLRDIVIILGLISEKKAIFKNISNIKHLRNASGKKYIIRDYQTQGQTAIFKKSQQIADIVAEDEDVDQEPVTTDKAEIYVREEKYVPRVATPEATSVLRYPLSRLNKIKSVSIERGSCFEYLKNRFTPYSLCTTVL